MGFNSKKQIIIIGLDGLDPVLIRELLPTLPTFKALIKNGLFGPLTSCDPPITIPAWTAMSTGLTPGELGLYGFTNKKKNSYETFVPDDTYISALRAWDILGAHGFRSIVIGMPQTAPARPINGCLVGGQVIGQAASISTWPPTLAKNLDFWAGGQYLADTIGHRTLAPLAILKQAKLNTSSTFQLAASLLKKESWDLLWLVIMAPDRIQHAALPQEPSFANLDSSPVGEYYRYLDNELAKFLSTIPAGTALLLVSDHGTKPCKGSFWLNRWLIQKGYLKLKEHLIHPTAFSPELIDWSQSRAYGQGGYYGRIYLNISGREPNGIVSTADSQLLINEITDQLRKMDTPWSNESNIVLLPKEIYPSTKGNPPDLMVYAANLTARTIGLLDNSPEIWNSPTPAGQLDKANHGKEGLFITNTTSYNQNLDSIYDILPWIKNNLLP